MSNNIGEGLEIFPAIFRNDIDKIYHLVQLFGPNIKDDIGDSALWYSISQDQFSSFKILLQYGADVYEKNFLGDNVLHFAAKYNKLEFVSEILIYQENLNVTSTQGFTAINYAVEFESFDAANILFRAGASLDIKDDVFNMSARQRAKAANFEFN